MPHLLLAAILLGPIAPAPGDSAPLPEKVEPQLLVRDITFAEGPTFDSKGNLYFVNYKGNGNIGRRTPAGDVAVWLKLPDPPPDPAGKVLHAFPFGLKADAMDRLIAADYGGRRLVRISVDRKVETLADSFEGRLFNNPNDVCLDRAGNIYFTDPQGPDKDSVGAIYRYTAAGKLTRLHTGLKYPNGIAVALDQKSLYVAETWTRSVVAFDLARDGTLSRERRVYQFATPTVDGLAVDEQGRIWVARLDNKSVDVLAPAGKLLASYPVGGDRVTNLAWHEKSLYATVAGRVGAIFRLDVNVRGAEQPGGTVKGTVRIEGEAPAAQEWKLEEAMRRVTSEKVYREETWLVGKDRGLANCVVTLKAKKPADQVAPKPLEKTILDKVGVRYVPRVLVVTPGTEVVFRNKESPCQGFQVVSTRCPEHNFNYLVRPGTEEAVTFRARDTCVVGCPVRAYARGYVVVADTPRFAVTDEKGQFEIRGVPAGDYRVTVWHEAAGRLTKDAGPAEVTLDGKGEATLRYRVVPPDARKK
jgi:gluconolactonase